MDTDTIIRRDGLTLRIVGDRIVIDCSRCGADSNAAEQLGLDDPYKAFEIADHHAAEEMVLHDIDIPINIEGEMLQHAFDMWLAIDYGQQ